MSPLATWEIKSTRLLPIASRILNMENQGRTSRGWLPDPTPRFPHGPWSFPACPYSLTRCALVMLWQGFHSVKSRKAICRHCQNWSPFVVQVHPALVQTPRGDSDRPPGRHIKSTQAILERHSNPSDDVTREVLSGTPDSFWVKAQVINTNYLLCLHVGSYCV
jgi:hypothetical protein